MLEKVRTLVYLGIKPIKERVQSHIVLKYYKDSQDYEIREICDYLKKYKKLTSINYEFTQNEDWLSKYTIQKDNSSNLYYVLYNGKKMYFTKNHTNKKDIQVYLKTLIDEQNPKSPHCYLTDKFQISKGDIVLDAGVAEGNFAIDVLEKASKVILVECDKNWIEALRVTFSKEIESGKVVIEEKMLGDKISGNMTTIDELERKYGHIDFVKMDIEGAEISALTGGRNWIKNGRNKKLAICTYHNQNDYHDISSILLDEFECETSRGYICLNPLFGFKPPYFRKGVLRLTSK